MKLMSGSVDVLTIYWKLLHWRWKFMTKHILSNILILFFIIIIIVSVIAIAFVALIVLSGCHTATIRSSFILFCFFFLLKTKLFLIRILQINNNNNNGKKLLIEFVVWQLIWIQVDVVQKINFGLLFSWDCMRTKLSKQY